MQGASVYPTQTNFVLACVKDANRIFEGLKARRILIKNLHPWHPLLANCLRITVGTRQENDLLLSTIAELDTVEMNDVAKKATATARTARIDRMTRETSIMVEVDLDGTGRADLATGVPFLDHMLDQVARHGMIDLTVAARATCISTPTTPSRTSASPSARRSGRRSATRPG